MRPPTLLRDLSGPLALGVIYLALRFAFASLTQDDGLLTPDSAPDLGVAGLGLIVLVLRLAVVWVLPGVVVYRIVDRLLPPP